MKKRFLKGLLVMLMFIVISIITVVGFSSKLDATLHSGKWVLDDEDNIIGCAGSGKECVWGTIDPNPDPDN